MKVDFDITKIEFTPYCDNYDFILGATRDSEGDECYLGIDIPCKDDAEWRFWLLFEYDNVAWNISDEDKEYIKQEAMKYCLSNGYSYLLVMTMTNGIKFKENYTFILGLE